MKSKKLKLPYFHDCPCEKAVPGKNSTLYKTHKDGNPVRLLTAGNNTAIENLAIFVEKYCAPLPKELPSCIKDNAHLLDILDQINTSELKNGTMLISFEVVNMFPSIENEHGVLEVRNALDKRDILSPSTDCLIESLEICLYLNNSTFAGQSF